MADTRRVFVQQATLTPQLQMSAPVMAFVEPEDSWLMIVNEFVASCNDEEVEVDDRPAGMLENCRILHASTLQLITDASGLDDGKQYILCPSTMEFEAVLRKHGLPVPAPPPGSASGLGRRAERDSIATTDHLESLEDLSYYFDSSGTLRHCASNQAVYEIMSDERRAGEIDEIVKAAIFHIQMDMLADLNFKQAHVPIDPRPDEPKEARSSVFLTSDWRTNDDLLIVINGGRGVQPGIWSRDLLIQEGLEKGSMLPVFRRAKESGFAVAVLNPFTNNVMIGKDLHPIRNNASSDEHTLYVWDNIISRSQAKRVHILAYSFGAKLVTTLIQNREEQVVKRLSGIVFAEGAYKIDPNSTSPLVGNFLKQKAINFKADSEVPEGNHIPSAEEQLSCMCLSVGDLAAAAAADGKSHASSNGSSSSSKQQGKKASSNKARTISMALEMTFEYFAAARDRGCTAPQFVTEHKAHSRSLLVSVLRQRLSLKPRNKHPRSTSTSSATSSSEGGRPSKGAKQNRRSDATNLRTSILSSGRGGRAYSVPVTVSDFDLIKVIGKGVIGKVFLVRKVDTRVVYAMKVIRKSNVVRQDLQENIKTERLILEEIDHPFIARLCFSFQTKDKLYLVTDYCSGGELFHHMTDNGFTYELSRFYAAELVLALEHLHRVKVAYRDLKPENILLEESGHLRITDFGLSKLNVVSDRGAQTIAGTREYLAPEVYSLSKYGYAVDWWSLGVLIFEMLTGMHPFLDDNKEVMVRKITTPGVMQEIMPPNMPSEAASLLFGLLTHNPQERLGSRGSDEIRSHPFFAPIAWDKLMRREIAPPWKPVVKDELDVGNFDAEFTSEPVVDSVCTQQSVIMSATFDDFTFDPTISSMRRR